MQIFFITDVCMREKIKFSEINAIITYFVPNDDAVDEDGGVIDDLVKGSLVNWLRGTGI